MVIGVCDDDEVQLQYIKLKIMEWSKEKQVPCEVKLFQSAEELLFEHSDTFPFELLILDIQMGKMNGMELAKRVRTIDKDIRILFLTGLSDYVFEGYEVGAQRYLLKPIKEEQLHAAFDEVLIGLNQDIKKYFIFHYLGEMVKLEYNAIILIEALGHYLKMTTTNQTYDWKYSIGQISKELDTNFIQVHRSFIVNLRHVEKINKTDLSLSNGQIVPISRNKYQDLNEAFIRFYKGD